MRSIAAPTFRLATLQEAGLVREISAAAYIPAYQSVIGALPKPAYESYEQAIVEERVWLAECATRPAAVLVVEPAMDHMLIYSIAVHPQFQGQGLGRAMLTFAEKLAASLELPEMRLYTNTRMARNLALYRSVDYRVAGQRPHPSRRGEMLADMVKKLPG